MTFTGRVNQLWVFPVKSMGGARLERVQVDTTGLRGDRSWAVVDLVDPDDPDDPEGAPVTAAKEPRLRQVVPHLADGRLTLDVPGHPTGLAPDEAARALSSWLGRDVRLAHREGAGFVDVAPVHVVSTGSLADAAHAEECDACDVTQPRANLVLDLADAGPAERGWVGATISAGGVRLHVVRHPNHCLGVYADVLDPGELAVGDEVRLG